MFGIVLVCIVFDWLYWDCVWLLVLGFWCLSWFGRWLFLGRWFFNCWLEVFGENCFWIMIVVCWICWCCVCWIWICIVVYLVCWFGVVFVYSIFVVWVWCWRCGRRCNWWWCWIGCLVCWVWWCCWFGSLLIFLFYVCCFEFVWWLWLICWFWWLYIFWWCSRLCGVWVWCLGWVFYFGLCLM